MKSLPAWLPQTLPDAQLFYGEALGAAENEEQELETRRKLALGDLFYLLVFELKRRDLVHPWLFARCREVQANPNGRLDLWAREHGKSSIITFGLTVQNILNDPEITVGIFSHTRPTAKAFLRQIKGEFKTNESLKALFPDILWGNPEKESPKWSEDEGIVVRRTGNPKEATVEAWGLVDGQPTSKHFSHLIYDDVVTRESVTTPEMIKKTTEAWELSDNLGVAGGIRRYIGTRYHLFDTYQTMIERGVVEVRLHPATDDGKDTGNPVLMTREVLREKRKLQGPYTFGAQMLLDPQADRAQGFKKEWLKLWVPDTDPLDINFYMLVDPAGSKKRKNNDYTSIWVLGLAPDKNYYVFDMVRDRLNLTQRADTVIKLHRRWRPMGVGYEEYGMQADIEHLQFRQEQERYRFPVTPLGGKLVKEDRIRRLVPLFESGRVYLPTLMLKPDYEGRSVDLTEAFIREEYLAFPVAEHDDMLDGFSRILDEDLAAVFPDPMHQNFAAPPTHYDS